MEKFLDQAYAFGLDIGGKIIGAIILWIVGRYLIGLALKLLNVSLNKQKLDKTLVRYIGSATSVLLNVILMIAVLGVFGVETTTFAGLLAAAGVAIGMAWSGLLSNFAAGVFMIVLRPFKVGDYVIAGDVEGTVMEIGLFVTAINTPDNVRTFLGNGKVFGGTIKNFSTNPYRRVEGTAQLPHGVDPMEAKAALLEALAQIPNIAESPKPEVFISTFTLAGPVLTVRSFCHTQYYWDVYFSQNRAIAETFAAKGYPVPKQHWHLHGAAPAA
ncbi:MAG: mechanosensitive ion channel family protein [Myxococcales bacterium]|nr:mechanosensitive ion channel family protein [Myxococcales bacterium]MCB9521766.1 mechanosensitive ion channel family protein [Myxococcales bacterium]